MKQSLLEKAAGALDFPTEIIAGLTKIEIKGCREISIENHRGLLSYDTREVRVNGGDITIKISGDNFVIRAMTGSDLRIEGLMTGVEFLY